MPAIDYQYDPGKNNPSNMITGEEVSVSYSSDISVFPLHHPFFVDTLEVEGYDGSAWIPLKQNLDYVLSPSFLGASAASGNEICSYFLLMKEVTKVRYNYHALGQYEDERLLAEVTTITSGRNDLQTWLKLKGSSSHWGTIPRDPRLEGAGLLEIIAERLTLMADMVTSPYTTDKNVGPIITQLESENSLLNDRVDAVEGSTANNSAAVTTIQSEIAALEQDIQDVAAGSGTANTPDYDALVAGNDTVEVGVIPSTANGLLGFAVYTNGTDAEVVQINAVKTSTKCLITSFGRTSNLTEPVISFSGSFFNDEGRISITPRLSGDIKFKAVTKF